ncbi:hypothetical protein V1283_000322 [Bradyrhizobium sp. AZCC 2262]|uniref:hypothetical protein n=1 Tax=Bradyrhizobium sp. AZCC 2262 TaxID=3117022 RepID=UPI002FF22B86
MSFDQEELHLEATDLSQVAESYRLQVLESQPNSEGRRMMMLFLEVAGTAALLAQTPVGSARELSMQE